MTKKFSELRRDAHHGGWVLVSFQPEREQLLNISHHLWPISHSNELLCNPEAAGAKVIWRRTQPLPDGQHGVVKVIANRYPLFGIEGDEGREGVGMYDLMRGIGAHEIFIESEKHDDSLLTMHPRHYALTLTAYQDRMLDLRNDERLHVFSIFREWSTQKKNHPLHPHSQMIASAVYPLGITTELDSAQNYFNYKERCLFCDMIHQEQDDQERIVNENEHYISYCPYASRYPFEVHLFPKVHLSDFSKEPRERLESLAEMIYDVAYRLEKSIPGWSILMTLHTKPVFSSRRKMVRTVHMDYHWHFEFLPQAPGAIDWYTRCGTHIEPTAPENAAAYLSKIDVPSLWIK